MKHFRNEETAHAFFMNAADRAKMKHKVRSNEVDMVAAVNNLFKTVQSVNRITETTCLDCLRNTGEHIEMTEIDRDEDIKVYPISGPEVVRVNWIEYKCPECGEKITINK